MTINEIIMSLEMGIVYGIVAIGIYLTFRIINFPDLTCDGSFVLGSAVSSILLKAGYNPYLSLLAAIFSGGLAGFITGILNTQFKITDLLSGILVTFMLYSVNLHVMGDVPNIVFIESDTIFSSVPVLVILAVIGLIVCSIFNYLLITDFGLALRAIGQNRSLSQSCGINVNTITVLGLIFSNGLIGLSGALFSQHQGFADVGSGVGTVIIGLASVMIGESLMPHKSITVQLISCLIGSILYRILISIALHSEILGLETQNLNLITGIMVVGIMALPKRRLC